MKTTNMLAYLKNYSGEPIRIMEVCGTHTSAIAKSGIRSLLSPNIELLSGPGCPVCVTPAGYIDTLRTLALRDGCTIISFGDMLRVPGSDGSLSDARGQGGDIRMVYSPFDALKLAENEPEKNFVFAAVGFETIAPVYALLVEQAAERNVSNMRLLCALKTMPEVLKMMCKENIDAFIAPGHVAAICGADAFLSLAHEYSKPFCVAGFGDEDVIAAICDLVLQHEHGTAEVHNLYSSVVLSEGNITALSAVERVFKKGDAVWRGLGNVSHSGLYLKEAFCAFDAGSFLYPDNNATSCRCGDVICGRMTPDKCPMFGKTCTPQTPKGPCMVSSEGACGVWHANNII